MSMMYKLLVLCVLLGTGLSCSCVPGSFSKSRRDAICDDFERTDNIFSATVQEVFCKCLVTENVRNRFSCIKFVSGGEGTVNGETQETFFCDTAVGYAHEYLECSTVSEQVSRGQDDINPVALPETNLTSTGNCGLDDSPYYQGSGCDLTIQPWYYTINVTGVYKGNYTVGTLISSAGPDALTSCGQYNRILEVGTEYIVGIGGPCDPISAWSQVDVYNAEDIQLLNRTSIDPTVCGAATLVLYSFTVLITVALITSFLY